MDRIAYIVYFGAPKDGFEVYPRIGAAESLFASYYTSTGSDWIFTASKIGNVISHTYVKYGLLTAAQQGREGSCLGISIGLVDSYFADLDLLRREVYDKICEVFVSENILLELQKESGKLAFKAYNLKQVATYLDDKTQTIRNVLSDTYSEQFMPAASVPDSTESPVYALHPQSSVLAIQELFETYGVVRLTPSSPIETKSISQKADEQINALQRRNTLLVDQLNQRERLVDGLQKQLGPIDDDRRSGYYKGVLTSAAVYIERLEGEAVQLRLNASGEHRERMQRELSELRAKLSKQIDRNQQLESTLHSGQPRIPNPPDDQLRNLFSRHGGKIIATTVALVSLLTVIVLWRGSSDTPRVDDNVRTTASPAAMPATATPAEHSVGNIYVYDGRDPDIKTINGLIATALKRCENTPETKTRLLESIVSLNASLRLEQDVSTTQIRQVPLRFETPRDCTVNSPYFSLQK